MKSNVKKVNHRDVHHTLRLGPQQLFYAHLPDRQSSIKYASPDRLSISDIEYGISDYPSSDFNRIGLGLDWKFQKRVLHCLYLLFANDDRVWDHGGDEYSDHLEGIGVDHLAGSPL